MRTTNGLDRKWNFYTVYTTTKIQASEKGTMSGPVQFYQGVRQINRFRRGVDKVFDSGKTARSLI
jgi:hypothetical protein